MNFGVELGQGWQRVEMRPSTASPPAVRVHDDPDWVWAAMPLHGAEHARRYLQGLSIDSFALGELRQLLATSGRMDVASLSDGPLFDSLAQSLADHRLVVFTKVLTTEAARKIAERSSSSAFEVHDSQAVSPSSLFAKPLPAVSAPPVEAPLPEAEFASDMQDDQARTLTLAAEEGLPFCEVCQKVSESVPAPKPPSAPWTQPEQEQVPYGAEPMLMAA